MKTILLLVLLAVAYASAAASPQFDVALDEVWKSFKKLYNKEYKTIEIENQRREIFERNIKLINQHNLEEDVGKHTYRLKLNEFGDLSNEEFKRFYYGINLNSDSNREKTYYVPNKDIKIPDAVDWRTQGYVTPIKNQEQCGSCWAFSATAALEGQHFKQTGKLVSLSEQNLVDCSGKQGNMGCNGGLMDQAFQYIIDNKGIDTESSYPYQGVDGKCRFNKTNIGATMSKIIDLKSGSEDDLTNALATIGPIAAAMDASQSSFQFYASGIYYDPNCSSTQLDHGMSPVGYGSLGTGKDYYIGKNMWGTSWGMNGYVLMARNKNNNCGLATMASYPVV